MARKKKGFQKRPGFGPKPRPLETYNISGMVRGGIRKVTFDPRHIERLAAKGMSIVDMAGIFGNASATLERRMAEDDELRCAYARGKAHRRLDLRDWQNSLAKKGNAAMLIFLGKNELGQRDTRAVEHTGDVSGEVKIDIGENMMGVLERRLREFVRPDHGEVIEAEIAEMDALTPTAGDGEPN